MGNRSRHKAADGGTGCSSFISSSNPVGNAHSSNEFINLFRGLMNSFQEMDVPNWIRAGDEATAPSPLDGQLRFQFDSSGINSDRNAEIRFYNRVHLLMSSCHKDSVGIQAADPARSTGSALRKNMILSPTMCFDSNQGHTILVGEGVGNCKRCEPSLGVRSSVCGPGGRQIGFLGEIPKGDEGSYGLRVGCQVYLRWVELRRKTLVSNMHPWSGRDERSGAVREEELEAVESGSELAFRLAFKSLRLVDRGKSSIPIENTLSSENGYCYNEIDVWN
eukprot:gene9537-biopygen2838